MRATGLTVMYNLLFFLAGTILSVAIAIMLSEISSKKFIKISPEHHVSSVFYIMDGYGRYYVLFTEC